MIDLEQLHVIFAKGSPLENHVLRGISLNLPKSQFVTVIGSNGAGKSTLLNAIAGDIRLDSGRMMINQQDLTNTSTHARASSIARVFQDPKAGTCENLSILENLALALKRGQKRRLQFYGSSSEIELFKSRLSKLNLGLENRLNDKMGQLSGGQRQAVSLLMATLRPCEILLLDEHTAALDPKTAEFVMQLTHEIIAEQKLTALMVTHSMRQAIDYGDRIIMLHEGRVAFDIHDKRNRTLDVGDLLNLFKSTQGESLTDDSLLLG